MSMRIVQSQLWKNYRKSLKLLIFWNLNSLMSWWRLIIKIWLSILVTISASYFTFTLNLKSHTRHIMFGLMEGKRMRPILGTEMRPELRMLSICKRQLHSLWSISTWLMIKRINWSRLSEKLLTRRDQGTSTSLIMIASKNLKFCGLTSWQPLLKRTTKLSKLPDWRQKSRKQRKQETLYLICTKSMLRKLKIKKKLESEKSQSWILSWHQLQPKKRNELRKFENIHKWNNETQKLIMRRNAKCSKIRLISSKRNLIRKRRIIRNRRLIKQGLLFLKRISFRKSYLSMIEKWMRRQINLKKWRTITTKLLKNSKL